MDRSRPRRGRARRKCLACRHRATGLVRLVAGNPASARHRVRVLRWRIRLYLRPGPGYANILELAMRWSQLRAVRTGRRARPSLPWWLRMILPVTAYAVRPDSYTVLMESQSGSAPTFYLPSRVVAAVPLISTTTRHAATWADGLGVPTGALKTQRVLDGSSRHSRARRLGETKYPLTDLRKVSPHSRIVSNPRRILGLH